MAINNEKCRALWGQMFVQNVAKYFFQLLFFCVEFQIMCTEQHGYCSKISIYTASILAVQHFQIVVLNGYSSYSSMCTGFSFTMALSLALQTITSSNTLQSLLFVFTAVF